jgi:predicted SAM-dependent methyltransferase
METFVNPIARTMTDQHSVPKTKPAHRLHIGAMGPHSLAHPALRKLIDSSWIHLGDEPGIENRNLFLRIKNGLVRALRPVVNRIRGIDVPDYREIRKRTRFIPFYYKIGDRLELSSKSFSYIFSEHFFEHLYIDEAAELFRECHRLLNTGGVLRIAVPDADLRTYEHPEPVGYPNNRERWHEPDKHKTRWSVYSLTYALGQAGFAVNPLIYCDKFGKLHQEEPNRNTAIYRNSDKEPFVFDLSCIKRIDNSLIVDAIKPGPGVVENAQAVARKLHAESK